MIIINIMFIFDYKHFFMSVTDHFLFIWNCNDAVIFAMDFHYHYILSSILWNFAAFDF